MSSSVEAAASKAAKDHIESIKREILETVPEGSRAERDYIGMLNLLSKNLYQNRTHFLLELLQNVDDNKYVPNTIPTLILTYRNGTLRVDCNEVGFTRKDVEAICAIAQSTKLLSAHTTGQKGIGFKSCFGVAEAVFIASGQYTFNFDKNRRLGLLAPSWEKFPSSVLSTQTSTYLQLCPDTIDQLVDGIKQFDARHLLFLRNIRIIELQVSENHPIVLQKKERKTTHGFVHYKILQNKQPLLCYKAVVDQVQHKFPKDGRPGHKISETILAFQFSADFHTLIHTESQHVYSFLPVRDYGLNFIIQSDFELIANREDINESPWNSSIRTSITGTFLKAVEYFNRTDERYKWLYFIPFKLNGFLGPIVMEIRAALRRAPVLQAENGDMKCPDSLVYVPKDFQFEGKPFFLAKSIMSTYVSQKYPPDCEKYFKHLGVNELRTKQFVEDLRTYISEDKEDFRSRSSRWHSELAKVLYRRFVSTSEILQLEIIPLTDGSWVSGEDNEKRPCFITEDGRKFLPTGISLLAVDLSAQEDPDRKTLFRYLGVKDFSSEAIFKQIEDLHSLSSLPTSLSSQDLVSHAMFLFRHWGKRSGNVRLWVCTNEGEQPCRGDQVYFQLFKVGHRTFPVLSKLYFECIPPDERNDWNDWLGNKLNICRVPRLVSSLDDVFTVSEEMECIISHWPSKEVLDLLRRNWYVYFKWLSRGVQKDQSDQWKRSQDALQNRIASITVECMDKSRRPLYQTIFPSSTLMQIECTKVLPLLRLPEGPTHNWSFLENLSVKVQPDVEVWIRCLLLLKSQQVTGLTAEQLTLVYTQVEISYAKNVNTVLRSFRENNLIYIPGKSPPLWVSSENCIWETPKNFQLKNFYNIKAIYPQNKFLFSVLNIQWEVGIETLILEANHITDSDSLAYVLGNLQEINNYLGETPALTNEVIQSLYTCRIFPIFSITAGKQLSGLQSANSNLDWFIADRTHFRDSFYGHLPLLAAKVSSIEKFGHLLKILSCNERRLSNVAECLPENPESFHPENVYSKMLQSKIRFINCLLSRSTADEYPPLTEMKIRVSSAKEVRVNWRVKTKGSDITGRLISSRAIITRNKNILMVYMRTQDIASRRPPLELVEELSAIFKIREDYLGLLQFILENDDNQDIEEVLTKKGIDLLPKTNRHQKAIIEKSGATNTQTYKQLDSEPLREKPEKLPNRSILDHTPNVVDNSLPAIKSDIIEPQHKLPTENLSPLAGQESFKSVSHQPTVDLKPLPQKEAQTEAQTDDLITFDEAPESKVKVPPSTGNKTALNKASLISLSFTNDTTRPQTLTVAKDNDLISKVLGLVNTSAHVSHPDPSDRAAKAAEPHGRHDILGSLLKPSSNFGDRVDGKPINKEPLLRSFEVPSLPENSFKQEQASLKLMSRTTTQTSSLSTHEKTLDQIDNSRRQYRLWRVPQEATPVQKLLQSSVSQLLDTSPPPAHVSWPEKTFSPVQSLNTQPIQDVQVRETEESIPKVKRAQINQKFEILTKLSRLVDGTKIFRLTGQTSILYVNCETDLPDAESKPDDPQVLAVLHSRTQVFRNGDRSVFSLIPATTSTVDGESAFLGEVWVSQILLNHIGDNYKPERDWKSFMRMRLGYGTYIPSHKGDETPFVIKDRNGALSQFLVEHSYMPAKDWERLCPVYHIDVQTTEGPLETPFTLSAARLDTARQYTIIQKLSAEIKHVFILIRINRIQENPVASVFVDPWAFYTAGQMHVEINDKSYKVKFDKTAKPCFSLCKVERFSTNKPMRESSPVDSSHYITKNAILRSILLPRVQEHQLTDSLKGTNRIRLLQLLPGKELSHIQGRIQSFPLKSTPKYIAISYSWGSKLRQFSLHTSEGTIPLTSSLFLGLRRLRDKINPTYIWADAICIDQRDLKESREEKQEQIRLMPRIFQSAEKVFAWIGEDQDDSPQALNILRKLGELLLESKSNEAAAALLYKNGVGVPPPEDPVWAAISKLLARSWFRRIWIVQELVLASEVTIVCGEQRLPWDIFYAAVERCLQLASSQPDFTIGTEEDKKNILDLGKLRQLCRPNGNFRAPDNLFMLLQLCYQKEATDRRDRLFALLSMARDASIEAFNPDYESQLQEVVKRYAQVFVEEGYSLELLYRVRLSWRLDGFPTWLPDLTANRYPPRISEWNKSYSAGLRAFKPDEEVNESDELLNGINGNIARENNEVLILRGYVVDTVQSLGKIPSIIDDVTLYLKEIFVWTADVYNALSDEEIEDIKWRIPIGDALEPSSGKWEGEEGNGLSAFRSLIQFLKCHDPGKIWKSEARRMQVAAKSTLPLQPDDEMRKRLWPYLNTALDFAEVFSPAVVCGTRSGRVGVVPTDARPEDQIVVFQGAKVPFLIRRVEEGGGVEGAFEVVGQCYVHGIMYGETLDLCQEDEIRLV